jgi:hypothetical protein
MRATPSEDPSPAIRYRRALGSWVVAYIVVTLLGSGLFFLIAAIQDTGSSTHPLQNLSYPPRRAAQPGNGCKAPAAWPWPRHTASAHHGRLAAGIWTAL